MKIIDNGGTREETRRQVIAAFERFVQKNQLISVPSAGREGLGAPAASSGESIPPNQVSSGNALGVAMQGHYLSALCVAVFGILAISAGWFLHDIPLSHTKKTVSSVQASNTPVSAATNPISSRLKTLFTQAKPEARVS